MLGPLEVLRDGHAIALGGLKQRSLLAILLLHPNRSVSRDRLIDGVWGERAPPRAGETLDTYIYRLRKLVGNDRIVRQPGGYSLRVEPGELDLERFETLVAAAELREALALWRGPPLSDLRYEPFANGEVARLEQRRLLVLERRIDAELEDGMGAGLVPELEQLVREHPTRERLVGQLMLALYRGGRQVDALAAFQTVRRTLADDLGLEPGPELRELEGRILRHEDSLRPKREAISVRLRSGRRGITVAAIACAVAGLAAGLGVLLTSSHSPPQRVSNSAANSNRLVPLDMRTGGQQHAVALAGRPSAVIASAGALWVADSADGTVSRVDPRTGVVVDRIPVQGEPGSLAAGDGAVWAASTIGSTLERIDLRTDGVTQTVPLGNADPVSLAFDRGKLWIADTTDQALIELDPISGSVLRTLSIDLHPTSIGAGAGELWVAGYDTGTVEEIDPRSGQTIDTLRVGDGPAALASGPDALWVANSLDGTVSRIDPETDSVEQTIPVGSGPSALATTPGAVWVANQSSGTVSRIDLRRNEVVETVVVGGRPGSVAVDRGRLWVGTAALGADHRGGTLRLVTTVHFSTIDPALQDNGNGFLLGRLAYDTLVTFEPASGPAGLRLVPDLALQIPVPTDAGTTYSFDLRPGIRYSDGRLVEAGDFRRELQRVFRLHSPGADYYTGIVGAAACVRAPAHCDLSRGIVTNDEEGTVVFHLTAPDPDFLYKLTPYSFTAPVPPGTPNHDLGPSAVPGTGPYRIVSFGSSGLRFERNPYFHEWSYAAQPAGYPDAIVYVYSRSHAATVTAIERGAADWTLDLVLPGQLRDLQRRYPSQLRTSPAPIVEFVHLNTHAAPFDDARVRRALNDAIDRGKIARWYGGPKVAMPACQPLVPGLPGYARYCPYTLHPRSDGRWTAPNLAAARRLVAESRTRGERIDVWGRPTRSRFRRRSPYIAGVLRSLGYRVDLHRGRPRTSRTPCGGRTSCRSTATGSPTSPTPRRTSRSSSPATAERQWLLLRPELDREMRRAILLEGSDPVRADELWTSIDHEVTDEAGWVPTVDLSAVELVSKRLGDYQYNPVWGFVPSQAWLH